VQVRTSKLPRPASDAVRDGVRATVTSALTPVVRPKLPTPDRPALPALPRVSVPKQTGVPGSHQPHAPPVSAKAPEKVSAQMSPRPQAHVSPLPRAHVSPLPQAPALAATPGPSGVAEQPAEQARPRTTPLPVTPRQPADRSTSTGQAGDPGGGNAPVMATVPSSWRPEVAAAGHRLTTDLRARGRTVRYAGPPS